MSVFIQQLPALLGVVIGALGSYWAVARGERVRDRRERETRWEERRLAVYTDYARVLKKSVTLAYRVAASLGNDPHTHPLTPEEAAPLIAEATLAQDPYAEALLLLGNPEVVAKAREWVITVLEMEAFLRERTQDPQAWQALLAQQRAGGHGRIPLGGRGGGVAGYRQERPARGVARWQGQVPAYGRVVALAAGPLLC